MVAEVDSDDVRERLDELQVVDIRNPDAYESGHIPGAENLPPERLETVVEDRDWNDEVVVACYVGESSVQAARLIGHYSDAEVASLAGGYESWDDPLE